MPQCFGVREMGAGRRLLIVVTLAMAAACSSDQGLAPEAVPPPAAPNPALPASMGAALLVLVDETGTARRVLIVRNQRDPRRQQVERLGFRSFTPAADANGGMDVATRALHDAGEATGLPVTYHRRTDGWTLAVDASLDSTAVAKQTSLVQAAALSEASGGIPEQIAAINASLRDAEDNLNLAVQAVCASASRSPSAGGVDPAVVAPTSEGADCSAEARKSLIETSEFVVAAGAIIVALDACGASLGLACFTVPPLYVVYQKEGGEMVDASTALLNCLRK